MARVTPKRKEQIRNFVKKWEQFAEEDTNGKVNTILLLTSLRMIKELLGE